MYCCRSVWIAAVVLPLPMALGTAAFMRIEGFGAAGAMVPAAAGAVIARTSSRDGKTGVAVAELERLKRPIFQSLAYCPARGDTPKSALRPRSTCRRDR